MKRNYYGIYAENGLGVYYDYNRLLRNSQYTKGERVKGVSDQEEAEEFRRQLSDMEKEQLKKVNFTCTGTAHSSIKPLILAIMIGICLGYGLLKILGGR